MEAINIRPVAIWSDEERGYRRGLKHGIERGLRAGLERGLRTVLLETLHARGIDLHAVDRRHIAAETSTSRLRLWNRRALTAQSIAEVFAH